MGEARASDTRGYGSRHSRRRAVQALTAVAGSVLLVRAGVNDAPLPAFAQDDEEEDSSGRGRGRGRGGGDDNSGPGGNEGDEAVVPAVEIPPGSIEIRIVSDDAGGFVPGELTIDAGQAVTFVNAHSDEHTATGAGFDTGIIPEGGIATVVVDEPGTYLYACQIHPEMTGSIAVRGADGVVPQQAAESAPAPVDAVAVRIANLAFDPSALTIQTGMSVTWTNDDSVPHTVSARDGAFDSGIFDPGATFSWTFNEPGSFPYQCQLHPTMQGSVTVEGEPVTAGSPVPETAAPPDAAAQQPASRTRAPAGVWMVELIPEEGAALAPHQALLTLHTDGLVRADFAVMAAASSPDLRLGAGHGEWRTAGGGLEIALIALVLDAAGLFAGTATIEGQSQRGTDGGALEGTFAFAVSSPTGDPLSEGSGTWRGTLAPLEP